MEAGARVEVSEKKRYPGDFAMWKASKPGEPAWESPWGPGRPGWHIECSAMSMKYLGRTLDIHGGGLDLQFPHHENELAQSESYTDQPFARFWMHNGLLKMGTAKMAGSVGNVVNIADLLQRHDPETVRFLLLSTHYRSPIEYHDERLNEIRRALDGFYRFFERYQRITGEDFYSLQAPRTTHDHEALKNPPVAEAEEAYSEFRASMDDDFNTGGAVGRLFVLLTHLNKLADADRDFSSAGARDKVDFQNFKRGTLVLREMGQILGLFAEPVGAPNRRDDRLLDGLMQLVIDLRAELRKTKNFPLADQIRKRLGELGITLEDRPGGTGWRLG
jgi:cysteinyl-tRNA synthetase